MRRHLVILSLALFAAACRGERASSAAAGGTVVISTPADADVLFPQLSFTTQGKAVADQVFDYLADVGPRMNTVGDDGFTPRLADRWEWAKDSLSIAFHLNPNARWHDGLPVRAGDVRFTYQLSADAATGSRAAEFLRNVDSVSVRDSLTAVVWFHHRTPEQFFDVVYNLAILPEHVLKDVKRSDLKTSAFVRNPVGSGRFRFVRWEPGSLIELVADTANYRGRPKLDRLVWSIAPDPTAATTQLLAGQADFLEVVAGDGVKQVKRAQNLKLVPYPTLQYGYFGFNLSDTGDRSRPHPIFADRGVRQALSMALDRKSLVFNVLDSIGVLGIGPVVRAQASADTTIRQLPYDVARARRMLDSLGWRAGADGVREKGGHKLAFSLGVPTSSGTRMRMAVLIQEQLKQVGAKVDLEPLEFNAFTERLKAHKYDTMLMVWGTDPSPATIRQSWGTQPPSGADNSNFTGYSSPTFDALIDSASSSFDPMKSKAYYRRAYETIIADAPAVWLYELRLTAAGHARIHETGMRADGWWANLADWSIPPELRTARDMIGLRVAKK